jgi:molybdenum cofactor cytidylyltransferase
MGRPKAALPIQRGGETFASRVVRTCHAAGLTDIVVVTGAHDAAVRAAIGPGLRGVRFVRNPEWASGQLTSLLAGLGGDDQLVEAVLMTLVDVPLTSPDTYRRVLHAWRSSRACIVRPARGGEHGHPVIFDRSLFAELRQADPAVGAKAIVRARAAEILDVPVDDDGPFVDVDTPEEYARLTDRSAAATALSVQRF